MIAVQVFEKGFLGSPDEGTFPDKAKHVVNVPRIVEDGHDLGVLVRTQGVRIGVC